jgi:uncharacterized lipoprotein YmbA
MRYAVLAFCAACSLGGHRPNYQYYVLTSTHPAPARAPGEAHERTLAITQVTIPGYLDREQIATRTAANHIIYSTTDRWAEPLDQAFERTLREDLAGKLAPAGIAVQERGGRRAYDLAIDVLRFERSGANSVELWARWTLHAGPDVTDSGETRLQVPVTGTNSNAMAAALSTAVARMASELAPHVREADRVALRSLREVHSER